MHQEEKTYYYTSDIALASAVSISFPIVSIDKENPNKAIFIFNKTKGLEQLIKSYWNHTLKVDPQTYFNQLKAIKHRLYSEQ